MNDTQPPKNDEIMQPNMATISQETADQSKEVVGGVEEKQSLSRASGEAIQKPLSEANKAREAKKTIVIEYLRKLPIYKWAAAAAGIDPSTLENWRKEDIDFSFRCEAARSEAIQTLGRRATPDFILKNVDPQTFKDKKDVDVTSGGKPIPIMGGSSHVHDNDSVQKDK